MSVGLSFCNNSLFVYMLTIMVLYSSMQQDGFINILLTERILVVFSYRAILQVKAPTCEDVMGPIANSNAGSKRILFDACQLVDE